MKRHLLRVWIVAPLLIAVALAAACRSRSGPPQDAPRAARVPVATAPPAVAEQVGEGPVAVYGANVYSPGQKIYKELRQEDSLMAFLACQGEPDRVEVVENPGAAPLIRLEYSRGGLPHKGTVEIAPSPAGYYAAQPIDPNGSLKRSQSKKAKKSSESPSRPAPLPKRPKPAPPPDDPPSVDVPSEEAAEPVAAPEASPLPEPTAGQQDECPIEPWRSDCRDLCGPGAAWEWCEYED